IGIAKIGTNHEETKSAKSDLESISSLAPDRRQQGRQILPVEAIRRQNRMRRRPGCRRRHVLQEGGQSARRAEVDVSASALSLQPLYGFTKSNLAPDDIPEIIF